jgi:phosphatidylserine/phosphatidylglycerophosphate/cardiolipin synthase-like enzyme
MIIFDLETVYIGSANLTGAGIGMKGPNRRNFESGILTNEAKIVEAAIEQFDTLWMGTHCAKCGRKEFCIDKIK